MHEKHHLLINNSIFLKTILSLLFISFFLLIENKPLFSPSQVTVRPALHKITILPSITLNPSQSITPIKDQKVSYIALPSPTPSQSKNTGDWGVAKQVGEHTYQIRVGNDSVMGTPSEILQALNSYRQVHGKSALIWDSNLASYAQSRSDFFIKNGTVDSHAGFNQYLSTEKGFRELGFGSLGENSSYGYILTGVHLIEWVYASDEPHNANQLNAQWTHVGIGVAGSATDLIFGGNKL